MTGAHNDYQMDAQPEQGTPVVHAVILALQMGGEGKDKEHLANLARLDAHRTETQPAVVAAFPIAERGVQQQLKADVEQQEPFPVPRHILEIEQAHENEHEKPDGGRRQLDDNVLV